MFVDENTIMLDPTCGSGSAVRAAEALGAPRILGIELDPEFTDRANIELAKSRRNKSAA
jgi:DNA modification methylase